MSRGLSVIDQTHSGAVLACAHLRHRRFGWPRGCCKRETAEGTT